ncbi:MAG: hypothetical protein KF858_08825 [Candidatus Sumerlaeia bacterium]|nr:hypothetical protein [Candidatus Sumerlaeia bacterium]
MAVLLPVGRDAVVRARWKAAEIGSADAPESEGQSNHLTTTTTRSASWTASGGELRLVGEDVISWSPAGGTEAVTLAVEVNESWSVVRDPAQDGPSTTRTGSARVTMLPAVAFDRDGDGTLGGAFVGVYPNELNPNAPAPVANNPRTYTPPRSFHRLDDSTATLRLSANATLGTFAPEVFPAEGSGARFVAISPELIRFWEALHGVTASRRRPAPGELRVLRGFVSPHERQRLQRLGIPLAEFSRYQYGDALAIILDANRDNRMDDLNNDGRIDIADAEVLAGFIEQALTDAGLAGGIGVCASFEGPNHIGTPYVHVDLRGWNLRWREE